ncbi:acyl-CoA dehydrogenase family protein [Bradyrhizobium commune]|uniref:Acyl-CoA dehydrogenase family protein n=1 Tax=Bradyrhizobium commune TaxID=83627 RepID=A0A7S9D849_9BRAD|nr:acyl-CoA dehydrogenase family protein [Bradyrhizobium commune]QPF92976.1 acyl-CoA dehydrogenase family protein [Bradyrhizobium commune]
MAIDFRLTESQRELQFRSRNFAKDVLSSAIEAEALHTAEERFAATKPAYEAMIAAGFLRKCIPRSDGGENTGLTDTAIMVEELYAVNASLTLTLIGTLLGLLPLLIGGTREQRDRLLPRFLAPAGAPLAGFCASEPGGSANPASPPPGEGVRTSARLSGDRWIIHGRKSWVSSATGWDRKGADVLSVLCRTDPDATPEQGISVILVERPASGLVFGRAIESVGHRAHLLPQFEFQDVSVPRDNVLGGVGGGLALTGACFTGAAALVGVFAIALMRAAFEFTLGFARSERRGGIHPIIEHQAVGYALADAKMAIEATRCLCWRACQAVDMQSPSAQELAVEAKVYGSETAVRVLMDLMRVVGIESYDRALPLGRLLEDALALPLFGGGNVGVRRRQLHALLKRPEYDPLTTDVER